MPHVYSQVDKLQREPWVDGGNCISLIKAYAPGLRGSSTPTWREGAKVVGTPGIARGTAVATFENGKYPRRKEGEGNHAAFYLWQTSDAIYVMDQFTYGSRKQKVISQRRIPRLGKTPGGKYINPSNNADAFSVIER